MRPLEEVCPKTGEFCLMEDCIENSGIFAVCSQLKQCIAEKRSVSVIHVLNNERFYRTALRKAGSRVPETVHFVDGASQSPSDQLSLVRDHLEEGSVALVDDVDLLCSLHGPSQAVGLVKGLRDLIMKENISVSVLSHELEESSCPVRSFVRRIADETWIIRPLSSGSSFVADGTIHVKRLEGSVALRYKAQTGGAVAEQSQ